MQRSFGIWHTKCFPKATPPNQEELEDLCKKLGFHDELNVVGRAINSNNQEVQKSLNAEVKLMPVEFESLNATKVIAYAKFSPVKVNEGFTVHLKPSKPLAKLVSWDAADHAKCHRMELKCN
jgi:hypothetical protein